MPLEWRDRTCGIQFVVRFKLLALLSPYTISTHKDPGCPEGRIVAFRSDQDGVAVPAQGNGSALAHEVCGDRPGADEFCALLRPYVPIARKHPNSADVRMCSDVLVIARSSGDQCRAIVIEGNRKANKCRAHVASTGKFRLLRPHSS